MALEATFGISDQRTVGLTEKAYCIPNSQLGMAIAPLSETECSILEESR